MQPVHNYEITYILNPNLNDDEVSTQTERVTSLITSGGGEIVEVNPWGGKRRMAYPIQRHRDGYYVTTKFRSSPDTAYGLEAQLNINDNILRHLVIRLDPRKK